MGKTIFDILVGIAVIIGTGYTVALYYVSQPSSSGGFKAMFPLDWKFAVLGAAILISVWGLIAVRMGWIGSSEPPSVEFVKWPNPYHPVTVFGRTFTNERVVLDGYSYSNCTFENVTFVYNGTTPIQFSNNTVSGSRWYKSDNPAVNGTFVWMRGFGLIKNDVGQASDPGNMVAPPTIINKP